MQYLRTKLIIAAIFVVFLFFFSNDFGLIDIEKTAIITAIAIDSADEEYEVTAQIAVPEATDTNSENKKAQVSGTGGTIGAAIKDIGDKTGWFPNLQFCNLLIVGNDLTSGNVFKVLDYFSKTLRVQDSALVITTDGAAKKLLEVATPLDNISSFALQKILLKNPGFDSDVAETDIKTFCTDYYSESESSYMPVVTVSEQNATDGTGDNPSGGSGSESTGGQSGSSGGSGSGGGSGDPASGNATGNADGTGGKTLFNARETALFLKGVRVGKLNAEQTLLLNALTDKFRGTTIEIKGVETGGEKANYLLTVFRCIPKITVKATAESFTVKLNLNMYCKIVDQNTEKSDVTYAKNVPLPQAVKEKTERFLKDRIAELIEIEKETGCDFLFLKRKLLQYNYKYYPQYKDNYLSVMKTETDVTVSGQK